MGNYLLEALRSNLNPLQVVDLHNTGPRAALKLFAKVPNVRILVAGGDGTWRGFCRRSTKSAFEKTTRGHLTSGNRKRSRESFGMGGGYSNELISELLVQVAEAHTALLDRWQVEIVPNEPPKTPNKLASARDADDGSRAEKETDCVSKLPRHRCRRASSVTFPQDS